MTNEDWKREAATVAITDAKGKWQHFTFSTWEEAREAVNTARSQGKAAVFYNGATLPEPPESIMPAVPDKD